MTSTEETEKEKVTFRMPAPLRRRFRVVIARDGRSQEEVLNNMVEAWVERKEKEQAE